MPSTMSSIGANHTVVLDNCLLNQTVLYKSVEGPESMESMSQSQLMRALRGKIECGLRYQERPCEGGQAGTGL